jgi:hypothetical protein
MNNVKYAIHYSLQELRLDIQSEYRKKVTSTILEDVWESIAEKVAVTNIYPIAK